MTWDNGLYKKKVPQAPIDGTVHQKIAKKTQNTHFIRIYQTFISQGSYRCRGNCSIKCPSSRHTCVTHSWFFNCLRSVAVRWQDNLHKCNKELLKIEKRNKENHWEMIEIS